MDMDMDTDMDTDMDMDMDNYGYGNDGYYTDDELEVPFLRKITNKIFSKWWKKKK